KLKGELFGGDGDRDVEQRIQGNGSRGLHDVLSVDAAVPVILVHLEGGGLLHGNRLTDLAVELRVEVPVDEHRQYGGVVERRQRARGNDARGDQGVSHGGLPLLLSWGFQGSPPWLSPAQSLRRRIDWK